MSGSQIMDRRIRWKSSLRTRLEPLPRARHTGVALTQFCSIEDTVMTGRSIVVVLAPMLLSVATPGVAQVTVRLGDVFCVSWNQPFVTYSGQVYHRLVSP